MIKSISINARRWFDAGNTYFTAIVRVDGKIFARLPFQYNGSGHMYEFIASEVLREGGVIEGSYAGPWARNRGVQYSSKVIDVPNRSDLHAMGV